MYFNHVISYICTIHVLAFLTVSKRLENVHFPWHQHGTILVATIKYVVTSVMKILSDSRVLHSEQDKESHHQTEQSHGFRQGESQDSVWKQLLLQRWVPSIANDETTKHCPNSSTRSSYSDCGGSSTNELGGSVNVPADSAGLEASQCSLAQGALGQQSNTALWFDIRPGQHRGRQRSVKNPGTSTDLQQQHQKHEWWVQINNLHECMLSITQQMCFNSGNYSPFGSMFEGGWLLECHSVIHCNVWPVALSDDCK